MRNIVRQDDMNLVIRFQFRISYVKFGALRSSDDYADIELRIERSRICRGYGRVQGQRLG
ncbi:MAG TPA: hypothetical protein PLN05_03700 [Pyrinomonadaceae bacterium]|nr:hypothetical protein [Chloracidobacterium sp.]HRJ90327.1 hypothetical protein [Pyrinomonadaceae bacterium]HRK49525.1 hypothetical protein [Pyrinomonadaceae bacterium]